ncbi:MAG TPA: RNA-binding protein [Spirochaetes bacterium]|nr:RNA-binding protein [Spirochaetota bacterium]
MTLKSIYVDNLSKDVGEEDLYQEFKVYGEVGSVNIIKNKVDGQSRVFALVAMTNNADAEAAIKELNGKNLKGSKLNVKEAETEH